MCFHARYLLLGICSVIPFISHVGAWVARQTTPCQTATLCVKRQGIFRLHADDIWGGF